MSGEQFGLLGFIALLVLLALGVHIAIALGVVAVAGLVVLIGPGPGFGMLATGPYGIVASFSFVVLPLFLLMGEWALHAGISADAFQTAYKWLGRFPGGLALATPVAGARQASQTDLPPRLCA